MSEMIWIPSQTEAWEAVPVVSSDASTVTVRRRGVDVKIQGTLAAFDSVTPAALDEQVENLVELEAFNEGIILHHVKKRFLSDKIYTLVGNILIALNPYKPLDIYGPAVIEKMYHRVSRGEDPLPHVFSIAATAVYSMKQERKDQSVLISGESGAGKTEATKKILQFISTVCASTGSRVGMSIENQILDSNPLLESFGNAKTTRNNNSSRFGKYMEVHFDKKMHIKGCSITAYLLEKSRVVRPGPEERNYHIFYMLLAGASKEMRKDFALKPADQFNYLTAGHCLEVEHRSDATEFEELVFAMNNLAIDENTQYSLFKCLAAVLHLGNLTFAASKEVDGGSKVSSSADSRRIATLLGLEAESLERALCSKESTVNGETIYIALSPEQASDQRDSLAKYVYSKLFDMIVHRVNSSLFRGKHGTSIGVLDIFGFEVFRVNSFEQLCINYCNERLQTFFNEIIFENEMKMYSQEGLPVDDISFQDNIGCVRLIDLRGAGIFAYLDEEVTVPKGSDEKFVSKINQIFDDNPHTKSVFFLKSPKSPVTFTVRHFAGDVLYDATNFLEKNRDAIAESLLALLATSHVQLLSSPLPNTAETTAESSGPGKKGKSGSKMTLCAKFKADLDSLMTTLRSTAPHFIRCVKPNMEQVSNKMDAVLALNQLKYSGLFEAIRIRKSGYEVRLSHDLFVRRYRHCFASLPREIAERLKRVSSTNTNNNNNNSNNTNTNSNKGGNDAYLEQWQPVSEYMAQTLHARLCEEPQWIERRQQVEKALSLKTGGAGRNKKSAPSAQENTNTNTNKREIACGKNKVFLRSQTLKLLFDEMREASRDLVAVSLQRVVRGFLARTHLYALLGEAKRAKEAEKARERQEIARMRKEDEISMHAEQVFRGDTGLQQRLREAKEKRAKAERERQLQRRREAVLTIQRVVRGFLCRRTSRVFICERLLERALISNDDKMLERAINRPREWRVNSKLIHLYRKHAKALILDVMHESHVENKLQEAMLVKSTVMLREAIAEAKRHNMHSLKTLPNARLMLAMLNKNKILLAILSDELSKCVNMSVLMQKYDVLEFLILQATERQMQGEQLVIAAATKLQRVKNLLDLRQCMRHAIEICSPTKMARCMEERSNMVKIFGEQFLAQEANAIDNMFSMLRYQQTLLAAQDSSHAHSASVPLSAEMQELHLSPEDPAGEVREESAVGSSAAAQQRLTMHEIYKFVINKNIAAEENYDIDGDFAKLSLELIYLPKFVRDPLQKMRNAESRQEINRAIAEYVKLVPNEYHRKFYLRIFKWTVAFSVWNNPNPLIEEISAKLADEEDEEEEPFEDHSVSGSQQLEQILKTPIGKSFSSSVGTRSVSSMSTMSRSTSNANKPVAMGTMGRSVSTASAIAKKKTLAQQVQQKSGPFAQRQSKTKVAAREILKKGSKVAFRNYEHQTDSLINESLAELQSFQKSFQRSSKW